MEGLRAMLLLLASWFADREIGVPADSNPQALSLSKRQQARLGDLFVLVRFHA